MKLIPIPIKPELNRYVNGEIVTDNNSQILSEDMVEVDLPNGVLVYAGWYERGNDAGTYRIYVDYNLGRLIPYLETTDPFQAAHDVAVLAAEYQHYPVAATDSGSITTPWRRLALVG